MPTTCRVHGSIGTTRHAVSILAGRGTESQGTAEAPRAMSGRGHRPGGRGNPFEAAAGAGDSEPVTVVGSHPAAPPAHRVVACGYLSADALDLVLRWACEPKNSTL